MTGASATRERGEAEVRIAGRVVTGEKAEALPIITAAATLRTSSVRTIVYIRGLVELLEFGGRRARGVFSFLTQPVVLIEKWGFCKLLILKQGDARV